jgi:hypothetical protein
LIHLELTMPTHTVESPVLPPVRRWPRLLVLAAAGLLMLSPLGLLGWQQLTGSHGAAAHDTARRFFDALAEDDREQLASLVKPGAGDFVRAYLPTKLRLQRMQVELAPARVEGDTAEVPFVLRLRKDIEPGPLDRQLDDSRGILRLEREQERWRATAIVHPLNDKGDGLVVPLARPGTPAQTPVKRVFEPIRPLDVRQYEQSWQVSRQARQRPAGAVVQELADEMGIGKDLTLGDRGWRERPCTFTLERCSRLQALDTALRQTGVQLEYHAMSRFFVSRRTLAIPTAFAGPFLVRVPSYQEDALRVTATGGLQLEFLAVGLPPGVGQLLSLQTGSWPTPEIRAPDGRDLLHRSRMRRVSLPSVSSTLVPRIDVVRWSLPLCNLTAEVVKIAVVRGKLVVPMPQQVHNGELQLGGESAEARCATAKVGDVAVNLDLTQRRPKEGVPTTRPPAPLIATGPVGRVVFWRTLDALGQTLEQGSAACPGRGEVRLTPAAVAVGVQVVTVDMVEHPFTIRNISLEGRVPLRLEPPVFQGSPAPVSAKATLGQQGVGSPVGLHIRNHCQKPIDELSLRLRFQNRDGRALGEKRLVHPPLGRRTPFPLGPMIIIPLAVTPLVKGHEENNVQVPCDPPAGATRALVDVEEVFFSDGTTWAPLDKR